MGYDLKPNNDNFVKQFAAFAEWADESNGFEIW